MVRPGSPTPLWGAAGKAGYALSCVAAALVLAVSGFSYFVVRDVSAIGGSHAINNSPAHGAQNNLLKGVGRPHHWKSKRPSQDKPNATHTAARAGGAEQGG